MSDEDVEVEYVVENPVTKGKYAIHGPRQLTPREAALVAAYVDVNHPELRADPGETSDVDVTYEMLAFAVEADITFRISAEGGGWEVV